MGEVANSYKATYTGCAKTTVAQHPYGKDLEFTRCTASHIHIHTDLETDSVNEP
ncbi:MAG: hypothetical protein U9R01_08425 [candidate division WOR-3 bacterium]|nr:hypothetical protein [candidate division WOR-3 bacterium]